MDREKFLPIGSVVLLKGGTTRVMVTGYLAKGKETGDQEFDYMGCMFPVGVLSSEQTLLFNHDQITQISFIGLEDDEQKKFSSELSNYVANNTSTPQQAVASAPAQQTIASAPAQQTVASAPAQQTVASAPAQQTVASAPVQPQPEVAGPVPSMGTIESNPVSPQPSNDSARDDIFASIPNQ